MLYVGNSATRSRSITVNETTRVLKAKLWPLDPHVSVTHGRGTAFGWITILTSLPPDVVRGIAKDLEERGKISIRKYPDDMDDTMHECLSVKRRLIGVK